MNDAGIIISVIAMLGGIINVFLWIAIEVIQGRSLAGRSSNDSFFGPVNFFLLFLFALGCLISTISG